MLLSMETYRLRQRLDDKTAIRMIKEAGFDAFDYSACAPSGAHCDMLEDDFRERAIALRAYADSLGIPCNQAHAPFNDKVLLDAANLNEGNHLFSQIVRAIEVASIMGAKTIIVHAMKRPPEGETLFDANARLYKSLIPYAERFGVKIAIENLFLPVSEMERRLPVHADPKEHKSLVMAVESDMACACLDVGHANMVGVDPADSIRTLGREHLGALHIHDNFGLRDLHLLPYTGAIKWDTITDALAEIDYCGDMTLEIVGYVARLPLDMLPEGLRLAESVGRRLIREIEEKRGHKNV